MDTFNITSRICRVCRTELLCDQETGAEVHRDITYDKACAEIRKGRTETETVAAALQSIDDCGSMRDFYDNLHDQIPSDVPDTVWESDALSKGAGE